MPAALGTVLLARLLRAQRRASQPRRRRVCARAGQLLPRSLFALGGEPRLPAARQPERILLGGDVRLPPLALRIALLLALFPLVVGSHRGLRARAGGPPARLAQRLVSGAGSAPAEHVVLLPVRPGRGRGRARLVVAAGKHLSRTHGEHLARLAVHRQRHRARLAANTSPVSRLPVAVQLLQLFRGWLWQRLQQLPLDARALRG